MGTGAPLKQALAEAGMSQSELARILGCGESQVSKWANGIMRPGKENRRRIARTLRRSQRSLWPELSTVQRSGDTG